MSDHPSDEATVKVGWYVFGDLDGHDKIKGSIDLVREHVGEHVDDKLIDAFEKTIAQGVWLNCLYIMNKTIE